VRILSVYVTPEEYNELVSSSEKCQDLKKHASVEVSTPNPGGTSLKRAQTFHAVSSKDSESEQKGDPVICVQKKGDNEDSDKFSTSSNEVIEPIESPKPMTPLTTASLFRKVKKAAAHASASIESRSSESESSEPNALEKLSCHQNSLEENEEDLLPDIMNEVLEAKGIATLLMESEVPESNPVEDLELPSSPVTPPALKAPFSPRKMRPRTSSVAEKQETELERMELYVQGSSDTILALFMDAGTAQNKDVIVRLVQSVCLLSQDVQCSLCSGNESCRI
jgi:hypothetical protein